MNGKDYDAICAEATSAAESRLLGHFKLYGGEVWTIGTGCENCRNAVEDASVLKKCSVCHAALFCNAECLKNSWRRHKNECVVITTLRKHGMQESTEAANLLLSLLKTMGWQDADKGCSEPKVAGVAASLQMHQACLPGWFCSVDYEAESKERQKELFNAALVLFALLRDEESWTRDKESFPRSSYTHIESIPRAKSSQPSFVQQLLAVNGHLLLFTAWLQHPEPPATQSIPLEDRGFYGIIDSILQVGAIRGAIDNFMDAR